jgi:hypothetical protein
LGAIQSNRHRPDHRSEPPAKLADGFAAAEMNGLPPELKAKLDELTHGWRAADAER